MTDLMETIYAKVCGDFTAELLREDGEYLSRTRYLAAQRERLCAALDGDAAQQVSDLLDEQGAIGELREFACFRVGLRMALALINPA